jgi:hypothetical protein
VLCMQHNSVSAIANFPGAFCSEAAEATSSQSMQYDAHIM